MNDTTGIHADWNSPTSWRRRPGVPAAVTIPSVAAAGDSPPPAAVSLIPNAASPAS